MTIKPTLSSCNTSSTKHFTNNTIEDNTKQGNKTHQQAPPPPPPSPPPPPPPPPVDSLEGHLRPSLHLGDVLSSPELFQGEEGHTQLVIPGEGLCHLPQPWPGYL